MNKDNNISKKKKLNQSKSVSPTILNVKQPNAYSHKLTHKLQ